MATKKNHKTQPDPVETNEDTEDAPEPDPKADLQKVIDRLKTLRDTGVTPSDLHPIIDDLTALQDQL